MADSPVDFEKIDSDSSAVGDGTSYNSTETSFHYHDMSWRWVGGDTGDWSDPANWALYDGTNNLVTTEGSVPQAEQNADVSLSPPSGADSVTVVLNAPDYNQIRSLSVWQNATLKITAQADSNIDGNVFATAGFENDGTIIIDTPSKVELGGVTMNRSDGTITIMNNHGNVIFDSSNLNSGGTVNLINASLGSAGQPVWVSGGTVNMQNSSIYMNSGEAVATINVDPTTVNTIYVQDNGFLHGGAQVTNSENAVINGISENTRFGIAGLASEPNSATYTKNTDGSYTLTVNLEDGSKLTYGNLHMADGYTPPATVQIVPDTAASGWDIEDTTSSAGTYTGDKLHTDISAIASSATAAGGDSSQYSSTPTSYHQHDMSWRWTGATSDDWNDSSNWALYDSTNNKVDTSDANVWTNNPVPQSQQNADVNISWDGNTTTPCVVVDNAADYNQIRSLSVWENGTLKITAQGDSQYSGNVFATAGFENNGTIIIDTPSKVELGGVAMNRDDGTITIMNNQGNVTLDNGIINNDGTLNLINASLGTADQPVWVQGGTVNMQQNSTLFAKPGISYDSKTTINVDPDNVNTIYIDDDGDKSVSGNVLVNGISKNTHFGIAGLTAEPTSAIYTNNGDGSYTLNIQLADGNVVQYADVVPANGYEPPATASIEKDGTTGWLVEDETVCFLSGSMIRTAKGDVAVEDIQIGDEVVAFDWQNNREISSPVVWVGKAHATAHAGLANDEAGYPVRILKDAIADGVPYKDMLITPEHCLFFEGKFVPARMLVNGVSIFYDKSITSYDYYHVETAQHSVITADGMLTESYLDTGNRRAFRQVGKVATLNGKARTWADDAAAPLCVDRAFVEPLFRQLELRENNVNGGQVVEVAPAQTTDPDLHLMTQTGASIRPMRVQGDKYSFMLPPNTKSVRIVSRASRPADVIGPFVDDRRYMGVAVADVRVQTARKLQVITAHLQASKPAGWHDTDWKGCAWTNGDAVLPLDENVAQNAMAILSLTIRAAGPYLVDEDMEKGAAQAV
ncbi:hypothetical protein CSR02_16105 [Acetobacter pomorum]|uniref:Hedgehog/Intein (Hint) domain-containing protein n=1 Tax=Acetobacter pomorum TaxID=65959 RepID=A0A2G4RA28_9PROT|nr:Hint domain-containing protein [Acetobacter pomorum]PHY92635.1 hypothetical protein CSR02_16105 [Acetobacter pomorum]GBR51735.1 hypothetical protein AA11825_2056 [Acetobacter pomorum DSM 11825]